MNDEYFKGYFSCLRSCQNLLTEALEKTHQTDETKFMYNYVNTEIKKLLETIQKTSIPPYPKPDPIVLTNNDILF